MATGKISYLTINHNKAWTVHIIFGTYSFSINSLWPNDAIRGRRSGSTLAQVMACCLMAPSHYLNQCWLITSKICIIHRRTRGQWVKGISVLITWNPWSPEIPSDLPQTSAPTLPSPIITHSSSGSIGYSVLVKVCVNRATRAEAT